MTPCKVLRLTVPDPRIEKNMGLVYLVVNKYRRTFWGDWILFDDLVQEGTIGLMRGLQSFRPGKSTDYLVSFIKVYITRYLKKERVWKNFAGTDVDEIPQKFVEDQNRPPDIVSLVFVSEMKALLSRMSLTPQLRTVLQRRILDEHPLSLQQVASCLGVGSRERARQVEAELRVKVQKYLLRHISSI